MITALRRPPYSEWERGISPTGTFRNFPVEKSREKQRVLIARALAQQADHLLLDEPTNHLGIRYQHEVLSLVRDLGVTTIVVLHDLNLAARYCEQLVLLDNARSPAPAGPKTC